MMRRVSSGMTVIPEKLFFRIGEVATLTGVAPYVLRYWESEFKLLRPQKNEAGQRVYRRKDVELVVQIKHLLYEERLTLEGARKRLRQDTPHREQMDLPLADSQSRETLRKIKGRLEGLRRLLTRSPA